MDAAGERAAIPSTVYDDVALLWEYNQLHHELRRCDVAIGLGSHDLGVATYAAELFHRGLSPLLVFTGANSPTTADKFPGGEGVHYRNRAIKLGVDPGAVLVEDRATNTQENIEFSRLLLADLGHQISSVLLVCRPSQQRRAYATAEVVWPEVSLTCASRPVSLEEYMGDIGDSKLVIDIIVGDTQRVLAYPSFGYASEQPVPAEVPSALSRLIQAGYTTRQIGHHPFSGGE